MTTTRRFTVIGGLVSCLVLVVGCSEEGSTTSETTTAVQVSAPEVQTSGAPTSATSPSAASSSPTSSSKAPTSESDSQPARTDPSTLEEVPLGASMFTGQGQGYRGTQFKNSDGTVRCNIKGTSISTTAICFSETADFSDVKISPLSIEKNTTNSVGWSAKENRTYSEFNQEPTAALYQGDLFNYPNVGTLEPGKKVTIPVNLLPQTVICGNKDDIITCVVKATSHGFSISKTTVHSW